MKYGIAVPRSPVAKFLEHPLNKRVVLPDGSHGVVRQVRETPEGPIYKVQGVDADGHFCAYQSISCWFTGNELRVRYFAAYIDPEWSRS